MSEIEIEKIFVCPLCYHSCRWWQYIGWAQEYGYIDTSGVYHEEEYEPTDETEQYCPHCDEEVYFEDALVQLSIDNVEKTVKIIAPHHRNREALIEALEEYYSFDGYTIYVNGKHVNEEEKEEEREEKKKKKPALWGW